MTTEVTAILPSTAVVDWEYPTPPTDLIFDDGEPLETNRHRIAMNVLIHSMITALANRNDYFAGGNMFLYYSSAQVKNRDFRRLDFFVVLNVDGRTDRQGWVVWEENGRYPDVIVELMSPSTSAIDLGEKKDIYEQTFRTPEYFVYNPFNPNSLRGWRLDDHQTYQPLEPNEKGWLWSHKLGLWLGTWEGTILRETAFWARFYDENHNLILLPEELAQQQAEFATQQAQIAVQQAQIAAQQVQMAEQKAQSAEQKAQSAEQKAQSAEQKAQIAEQEAQLAKKQAEMAEQEAQSAKKQVEMAEQEAQSAKKQVEMAEQEAQSAKKQVEMAEQRAQSAEQLLLTAQIQGALRPLLRLLTKRFGPVSPEVEQQLQLLEVNQLENLVEVALTVDSLAQFLDNLD